MSHVAVAVRDLARSVRFYRELVGADVVYQDAGFVQLQTPGSRDVIVLERKPGRAGKTGAVSHFGFRLKRVEPVEKIKAAVRAAGGRVKRAGEFVPGEPYVFAADPDGNEVEIWFELPTALDPPARRRTG